MKKVLAIIMLVLIISFPSCKYVIEDEPSPGATSDEATVHTDPEFKWYPQEEFEAICREGKYPKQFIRSIDDVISVSHYREDGTTVQVEYQINKVSTTQDIGSLQKNALYKYEEFLAPWVDEYDTLSITYPRTKYRVENGGLDSIAVETVDARPVMVLVDLTVTNKSDDVVETHMPGTVYTYEFESYDDEFMKRKENIYYSTDRSHVSPWSDSIYFPQSQYIDSENEIKKAKRFFWYELKPNEVLECQVGYLVDEDLLPFAYLVYAGAWTQYGNQFPTLVKLF